MTTGLKSNAIKACINERLSISMGYSMKLGRVVCFYRLSTNWKIFSVLGCNMQHTYYTWGNLYLRNSFDTTGEHFSAGRR